jgi:tetratricopeptide (TPR) repeat protein
MKKWMCGALLAALLLTGCGRTSARSLFTDGTKALNAGEYETAAEDFQQVVESGYYKAEAYRALGLAQMSSASYAEAAISFQRSLLEIDRQGEDFTRDVKLYLAYCREHSGEKDKALSIYDELLKKKADTEVYYLRGRLNLNSGKSKKAKSDFDKAVASGASYDLYINIFKCYEALDMSADGAAYLEKALTIVSRNETDYYNKGLVNYYLQNYQEARDELIEAVNKDSTDMKAVFLLGEVYLAMDDAANARAVFNGYLDDETTAATALNGLALCDISEGNYESALKNVEKGLDYEDESANQGLMYNEIVIYEYQNEWDKAKAKSAAYVAKYPTDEAGLRENEFLSTR